VGGGVDLLHHQFGPADHAGLGEQMVAIREIHRTLHRVSTGVVPVYGFDKGFSTAMTSKLIFDIGANNGDDTAFYLSKGFRVVAVEADPALCRQLETRFADAIGAGVLQIENVGVAGADGTLDFYVNSYSEWSSFVKAGKATHENSHEKITIQTIPMVRLLERHGTPYYLKIDIEGFEKAALTTLRADMPLPDYMSFEVNADWTFLVDFLSGHGYQSFALVRQGRDVLPDPPQPAREGSYVAQKFKMSMSGCFGQEITAPWVSADGIVTTMAEELKAADARQARGQPSGWHDIHCRRLPA